MLHLKKYFTEGLIQIAILLSLCGVIVDVGLGPYLPLSWEDMILGPTSALTQTQFHNLRNIEDGHRLHPKSVDLDTFFTARRLLGWVHSADRLQVPRAELETWLVQREPDPLPLGHPDQLSPLGRGLTGEERDHDGSAVEPRTGAGAGQEEELSDAGATRAELEPQTGRDPELWPTLPSDDPSDLEIHWQDVFSIMQPEDKDFDMWTSPDHTPCSRARWTPVDVGSEALLHHCTDLETEAPLQHGALNGLLGSGRQSEPEHVLLPLTPSAQLDDQSAAFHDSSVFTCHSPPHHMDLLAEETGHADDSDAFNMNLLVPDLADNMEDCPSHLDANAHSWDSTPSSSANSQEGNVTQDCLGSPSRTTADDKEADIEGEDDLQSPLSGLLDDIAMLDDVRLLDLALDDAFSPENCLDCDMVQTEPKTDKHCVSGDAGREDQSQAGVQREGEDEAETDSGLSLDFSHSPASPCDSEASSYSSSSSSLSPVESLSSKDSDDDAEEAFADSDMEVAVSIKQEEEEEEEEALGAVGGWKTDTVKKVKYEDHTFFEGFRIDHDHTYNQPWSQASPPPLGKMQSQHIRPNPSSYRRLTKASAWGRDERRAQTLKIPFSSELIVNLPVEEFNDLLTNRQLSEEQVALIKDIRRRGKNKIAAQNCRKRKLDVLLGLEDEVSALTRRRSWLLREKREALKKLQEVKRQLGALYQEVSSRLRDEHLLHFGPGGGGVSVATNRRQAPLYRRRKTGKKQEKE
ncbi:endoplasmic reticulum membrane sensor NFE2L1a isoform X2 [Betta splendens]|uniref:Endoplasmic reticulum membrane sensor NFE2L1 n=1 Tax=Betta splendens TaxID=158456 RepID=A0A6P7NB71_BETSP|nr:endoplasmic reticulum membrane sensor NFE2L1a isoform X2 [Betta splendens]